MEDHTRQCIIVGSTNNNDGFLWDITGNRRFWPVTCSTKAPHKPWEVKEIVPGLWAEAFHDYKAGEPLYLTNELEAVANHDQVAALESDVREGMIAEYLDTLLPEDWDTMDISECRLSSGERLRGCAARRHSGMVTHRTRPVKDR